VPTDNEKLTLFMGATFSLAIDSLTRVRWVSLREAETLTLDEFDCAVLDWVFDAEPRYWYWCWSRWATLGSDCWSAAPCRSAPERARLAAG